MPTRLPRVVFVTLRQIVLPVWAIFAISLIALVIMMDRQLDMYDEGLVLTAAMRMRAGDMPHRDFYFVYGPAGPWLLTKLWAISPAWFMIERAYGVIIQSSIVALCYRLLRSQISPSIAILLSIVCLFWMIGLRSYLYPSFPAVLLALVGASLLLSGNGVRPKPGVLLLAGGCAGLAALFRYDAGIPIMVAQGAYLLLLGRCVATARTDMVTIGRELALTLLGFVVATAPVVWIYWQGGVFGHWWQDIITSATTYYVSHRSLPFPGAMAMVRKPVLTGVYFPIAAVATSTIAFVISRIDVPTTDNTHSQKLAVMMTSLTVALYYKGIVRPEPLHFMISIVPALILMALSINFFLQGERRRRFVAITLLALTALPATRGAASAIRRMTWDPGRPLAIWLMTPTVERSYSIATALCQPNPMIFGAWLSDAQYSVVSFMREHSQARDKILVAAGRTDRFFINSPALYFAMDRQPGTHWHIFDPGLQTRKDIQQAMIHDLVVNDVNWIVRDMSSDGWQEPNASIVASGVLLLDRWIGRRYRLVMRKGAVSIWLRNNRALSQRGCIADRKSL